MTRSRLAVQDVNRKTSAAHSNRNPRVARSRFCGPNMLPRTLAKRPPSAAPTIPPLPISENSRLAWRVSKTNPASDHTWLGTRTAKMPTHT